MNTRARWVRRIGWIVAALAIVGAWSVNEAQLFARERLPAYVTQRLSQALHRPVSVGSVSFLPIGAEQRVQASGLDFVADLHPRSVRYTAKAANWTGGGLTATGLLIQGDADRNRVNIARSHANVQGGTLAANGTYVSQDGD